MPNVSPTLEGVSFDHYEVLTRTDGSLHELGRGAMGITYKAFDKNLRVPVALKVINRQNLNDTSARERFVQEARSAALLRHQHVASVFHLGAEGETYFYAMEYIDGETVECLLKRRGPLPALVVMRIGLQVARALSAAQQHGLIHRDIKPSNLMLVNAEGELCVKVIDFGLAMTARPEGAPVDEDMPTQVGFMGTPHYASPEQLEEKELDVRSDIYSLGATLWYMLTGETLFSGPLRKVMRAHLTDPPPWNKLVDVPEPVVMLLRSMLAKEPEGRPQTPALLRREIEACLEEAERGGKPVQEEEREIAEETQEHRSRLPMSEFATRRVVAGHLEVLRQLGETNEGWLFQAMDLMSHREVRMLVLRYDFKDTPALFTQLQAEVDRLSAAEHPNLLRLHSAEMVHDLAAVVMEWTRGVTLREVLRTRRALRPSEVMVLLKQMAPAVDCAVQFEVRQLDLALHQVFLHLPGEGLDDPSALLPKPIGEWPEFVVKLNPLSVTRELGVSDTWAGNQTMVDQSQTLTLSGANLGTRYARMLAALVYELLGGAAKPLLAAAGGTTRYTPLANLTEEGNEVLRRAIDPGRGFASAAELLHALEKVDPLESHARESLAARSSTASQIREAAGRSVVLPPRKSKAPMLVGAAALVLLGAGAFVLTRKTEPVPVQPTPPLANVPEATPDSTTVPTRPKGTPFPTDPNEMLNAAVKAAETVESGKDLTHSIEAWLKVVNDFPNAAVGRQKLDVLLDTVRFQQEKLSPAELDRYGEALKKAADLGVVSAMLLLADSTLQTTPQEAFGWYERAAQKGVPTAITRVGLMYASGIGAPKDLKKAVTYLEKAADKGEPSAQFAFGECLYFGKGIDKDVSRAIGFLRTSAAKENVRAMNLLGYCYMHGTECKKDSEEAARLFEKAAEKGDGEAMGNLGVLYMKGDGVKQNQRKAVELFLAGARANNAFCMFNYAQCLELGAGGVTASLADATTWYQRAAEGGNQNALRWCKEHKVEVTPKQP